MSHDKSTGDVQLYIDQSLLSDSGIYAVSVSRGSDRATSQVRVGVISERPVFTQGLTDQTAIAGQPVTFNVAVRGIPRPQIRWFIGGAEVTDTADKYVMTVDEDGRAELRIVTVSPSDIGLMCECKASSAAGDVVSMAYLVPGWCQSKSAVPAFCARTLRVSG